jgi:hypothetical protein
MKCRALEPCNKRAYYNFIGLEGRFCGVHKSEGMTNTVSKRCEDCKDKQPSYNFLGQKAKYCLDCKKPEMVNVVNKVCECCKKRRASFNTKQTKTPRFCNKCLKEKYKEEKIYNVVVKKCIECKKNNARYNIQNELNSALYCKHCVDSLDLKNMIDVRRERDMCIVCKEVKATTGELGLIKYCKFCAECIGLEYIDNKNTKCSKCKIKRVNPKYKPFCASCFAA